MILWSKGLGKLVLSMRLSERSGMGVRDQQIVIDGTMGSPTFWDYAVNLAENDVVDFIGLLNQPLPVRLLVTNPKRLSILWASLIGIGCFVRRTLFRFLGGRGVDSAASLSVTVKAKKLEQEGGEG
ncbi:MAG: hypothetical protein JRG80_01210 [Deltaproteobacteria bacterium]|nr:hypothetical protein [Deltaproteobacteria bacterium]MBW2397872.1 hypothetical protein [Deltaproteobacteria bacterium]MBW2665145.1 hypothetical protein [Deltaproteobacteria bacterium]